MEKKHKKLNQPVSFLSNNKIFFIALSALILLIYGRTTQFEYIGFDDTLLIVDNSAFLKDLSNIPQAFKQDVFNLHNISGNRSNFYRPLLTVSLMIDAQFADASPKIYRFSNILYHILTCIFLFYLFEQLKIKPVIAKILTLLFAIHPIMTMAVAWIPGRNDILLALFCIVGLNYFIKYTETKSIKYMLFHFLFFMLALFTKENALMFVPVCFLYLIFIKRERKFSTDLLVIIAGYAAIIFMWYLLRASGLKDSPKQFTSFSEFIWGAIKNYPLFFQYINKIILPVNLSGLSTVDNTNYFLAAIALLLLIIGLYFSKEKRWDFIVFGSLWFVLFLSLTLFSPAPEIGGVEHRTYLPLIGLLIVISEMDFIKKIDSRNNNNLYFIPVIFIVLIALTFHNAGNFKNRFIFWESFLKKYPNSVKGYITLAGFYQQIGDYNNALNNYKEAERCDKKALNAHNNIGEVYKLQTKNEEAEIEYKKELELHPENSLAYNNLGLLYQNMGRTEEALKAYEKGLFINPNEQKIHNNIGITYAQQNRFIEAEKEFKEEIEINPKYADVYYNLGVLYQTLHREQEMINMWEEALKINPEHYNTQKALSKIRNVHPK